jgi:hypothetical protein
MMCVLEQAEHLAMSKKIPTNNYVNHFDPNKPHHLAFFQAVLDRVNELDPEALQEGGDLRSIWKAAVATKAPLITEEKAQPSRGQPGASATSWASIESMAKGAGAKFPELVAAQWALESGWGKHVSGKNNFFGLKAGGSDGAQHETKEFVDGKWITITAGFINFDTPEDCVAYLVDRWYKDFKGYKGVNNAADRSAAAKMLVNEGYATDPTYAEKLIKLMNENSPSRPKSSASVVQTQQSPVSPAAVVKADATQWKTRIQALNLSQPDASTCQAACIGMAVGDKDIASIRKKLTAQGVAGDPAVMGRVIKTYKNVNYVYDSNGSLEKVCEWLKQGELIITHGWFTGSGHVIILDGLVQNPATKGYSFDVKDPWSEFDGSSWSYNKTSKFFDGFYSEQVIYAACVAGASVRDAAAVYRAKQLDRKKGGMWIHRFRP